MLPLNWLRCKDHLALFNFKNMTTQLDTYLPQGLELLAK